MSNHVYKLVELVGSSPTGTDDASVASIGSMSAFRHRFDVHVIA